MRTPDNITCIGKDHAHLDISAYCLSWCHGC